MILEMLGRSVNLNELLLLDTLQTRKEQSYLEALSRHLLLGIHMEKGTVSIIFFAITSLFKFTLVAEHSNQHNDFEIYSLPVLNMDKHNT